MRYCIKKKQKKRLTDLNKQPSHGSGILSAGNLQEPGTKGGTRRTPAP